MAVMVVNFKVARMGSGPGLGLGSRPNLPGSELNGTNLPKTIITVPQSRNAGHRKPYACSYVKKEGLSIGGEVVQLYELFTTK